MSDEIDGLLRRADEAKMQSDGIDVNGAVAAALAAVSSGAAQALKQNAAAAEKAEDRFVEVEAGVTLCYRTLGKPSDPPVLCLTGLGAQLIEWDNALMEGMAAKGYYVIFFDNRDSGLSSRIVEAPATL